MTANDLRFGNTACAWDIAHGCGKPPGGHPRGRRGLRTSGRLGTRAAIQTFPVCGSTPAEEARSFDLLFSAANTTNDHAAALVVAEADERRPNFALTSSSEGRPSWRCRISTNWDAAAASGAARRQVVFLSGSHESTLIAGEVMAAALALQTRRRAVAVLTGNLKVARRA